MPDGPVALLKLDAEGSEPMILDGAQEVCARTGVLYSEYDPKLITACNRDPVEYLRTLRTRGFKLYKLSNSQMVELSSQPESKSIIIGIRFSGGNVDRVKDSVAEAYVSASSRTALKQQSK